MTSENDERATATMSDTSTTTSTPSVVAVVGVLVEEEV